MDGWCWCGAVLIVVMGVWCWCGVVLMVVLGGWCWFGVVLVLGGYKEMQVVLVLILCWW